MVETSNHTEPRIVEYGPQTLVGMGRVCKTSADCASVWTDEDGELLVYVPLQRAWVAEALAESPQAARPRCLSIWSAASRRDHLRRSVVALAPSCSRTRVRSHPQ